MELANRQCEPCRGGVPALVGEEIDRLLGQLGEGWEVVEGHHLTRQFDFADFAAALAFVNRVGALADEQGHHPDLYLAWGKVRLTVWTHKIDGLTESDFVFAARAEKLYAVD